MILLEIASETSGNLSMRMDVVIVASAGKLLVGVCMNFFSKSNRFDCCYLLHQREILKCSSLRD